MPNNKNKKIKNSNNKNNEYKAYKNENIKNNNKNNKNNEDDKYYKKIENEDVDKVYIKNEKNDNVTTNSNIFVMKLFVTLGVISFCFFSVYLMYYFFVEKSNIEVNMSTEKKMEYITINGEEVLSITKKYVSDLDYNMRYDVNNFKVFKYKKKDIYKSLEDERILLVVEKSQFPKSCISSNENILNYKNCYVILDDYTQEYYVSINKDVYKLTVKSPAKTEAVGVKNKIDYMLNSFVIV